MCCCCGHGHHCSCHEGGWQSHPGHRRRAGESPLEEYRRMLEEEREVLNRRLGLLDRELEELRKGGRPGEGR